MFEIHVSFMLDYILKVRIHFTLAGEDRRIVLNTREVGFEVICKTENFSTFMRYDRQPCLMLEMGK